MYHERALLWSQEPCCVREVDEHCVVGSPATGPGQHPTPTPGILPDADADADAPKNAMTPTTTVAIPSIICAMPVTQD